MEPGDDIIDALYRCRDPPSGPETEQDQHSQPARSGNAVFAISPGAGLYGSSADFQPYTNHTTSQPYSNHTTPQQYSNHTTPQQYSNHTTPQQYSNHTTPQQFSSHIPPQQFSNHIQPQQYSNHTAPLQYSNHTTPSPYTNRAAVQQLPNHSNSHHTTPQQYSNHSAYYNAAGSSSGTPLQKYNNSTTAQQQGSSNQLQQYNGTNSNGRRDSKASPIDNSSRLSGQRTFRGQGNTPVLSRYNGAGGTGRIGYNNTPQVRRRRASFTRSGSNPSSFEYKPSPIPRSASAFDYRTLPQHGQSALAQPDYGQYHSENEGPFLDDEPVYVPRSSLVDIIYRGDDEQLDRRHRGDELIELPSGARQRKSRPVPEFPSPGGSMAGEGSSELRHRVGASGAREERRGTTSLPRPSTNEGEARLEASPGSLLAGCNRATGLLVMLYISYRFSLYLLTLHDNELWFSEIMEVEREISFRTEQGLYYSYFKQLVEAPSLSEGLSQLQFDNKTESINTINILHRFNVHQEVLLAALFKLYSFRLAPIFFYTYSVFFLQGVFLSALYLISWSLTGTWLTGVLTAVYVVVNRFDVTRVNFTVPLREHFSLPFIFCQFGCVGRYLAYKRAESFNETFHLVLIYVTSLLFTVTWQFAQFVLLIQALALFGLATVGLQDRDRVCRVLSTHMAVMLTVWYLQYYQSMVLNSLVVSLIPVAILSLQSQTDTDHQGLLRNTGLASVRILVAGLITLCLNMIIKVWMNQSADSHIFKFLKNKLSRDSTDFETQLYLCNEAFKWLDWSTYYRLFSSSALPSYLLFSLLCLASFLQSTLARWRPSPPPPSQAPISRANGVPPQLSSRSSSRAQLHQQREQEKLEEERKRSDAEQGAGSLLTALAARPDLCFHLGQSLPLGVLAASTLRMKCFWSPYICVLASVALSDPAVWSSIVAKVSGGPNQRVMNFTRHLILAFVILLLATHQRPIVEKEMEDLREFYDPDTVDLMQWIQANSHPSDAFSGSMQLLAGVKLCTGRTLTNHPHFEDKALRDRTKELYSVYSKLGPGEVHGVLRKYNTSYVILEDSICLAHRERCSVPDIMDLSNGHIPDDGIEDPPGLVASPHPRFCEEVRYDTEEYRKYFLKVFENKTFRIYKLTIE